ncbi:MAG TPA: VWA domain-containing protein [Gemmata sp.]
MRVRHKQPTLVSMWMLDVFCCALGCVTLLFLLNSKMATETAKANRTALRDLEHTDKKLAAALAALEATKLRLTSEEAERGKLAAALTDLEASRLKLADDARALADQLKLARTEKDETGRKLAVARDELRSAQKLLDATQLNLNATEKKVDVTAKELATARAQAADADLLLKKRQKDIEALAKKDADGTAQLDGLQRLMLTKDAERLALETRLNVAKKELTDLEAKMRATQRELATQLATAQTAAKAAAAELATAKAGAAKAGEELAAARAQIKDLTKKIDDASVTIIDLQGDKAKLADKYNRFQKENESRFAGIAMTGKKVVFLVDMSGSMGKRDLQTVDATKWKLVVETVCKVMRSIPTLEHYQVITFSSSAQWVLGNGDWQAAEGEKSVEAVRAALLKVKPVDDTNMFAAFEKGFSLRASGLDTMYLFSDGLPTSGPGLTPAQEKANPPLSETELGTVLGKHVRDTLTRTWNRPAAGQARVRINAVGFYFESVEVGAFLWALARDNDGSFVGMSKP